MATPWSDDFGPFDGRVWLNCAHQGPLPRVSVDAIRDAVALKVAPHHLTDSLFADIPRQVRDLLGRLVGTLSEDIILGNSTSYGIHLLANGIQWRTGDEVLLVRGDYPADILPWLALERKGVAVRFLTAHGSTVTGEDLEAALTPRTRLFCTTWVNSFTGYAVDLHDLGSVCRGHDVLFFVNGSQALGARPLDVGTTPVDAVTSCGFKWLCGPYATGFCWIRPDVRDDLQYNQAYWLAMQEGRDLEQMRDYRLRDDLGARKYDVFCAANFLDMMPWAAALQYLLDQGIARISAHAQGLVGRLIEGLDYAGYHLRSPRDEGSRSTLVLAEHHDTNHTREVYTTLRDAGIDIALREGQLRFSPHLYNTCEDIDRAVDLLVTA